MSTLFSLEVQGMHCGSCVNAVTAALQPVQGVSSVDVDLATGRVSVTGDFPQGGQALAQAVTAAGYPAKLAEKASADAGFSVTDAKKSGSSCCG